MQLYEILKLIDHDVWAAVKKGKEIELGSICEHLSKYILDEDIHCSEIEPNGFTDQAGISYLTLHCYDVTKVQQNDDELSFK